MATNDQRDLIEEFMEVFPRAYTVEDTMRLCFRLKEDRDRWRTTAEVLARELGHVDIAKHEYRNQEVADLMRDE